MEKKYQSLSIFDFQQQFPDDDAASEAAAQVSPDGFTIGTTRVNWIGIPHFYKPGRLIVLYVGDNYELVKSVENILGPQFAGGQLFPEA